jgi:hypothetical protein
MLHDKYLTEIFQPEFLSRSAVTHVLGGKNIKSNNNNNNNNNA